ncbi:Response regulator UvrY [anaerobic digester metagenome]
MSNPFRIYISDPHVIFREGIKKIINENQGYVIAGESDNWSNTEAFFQTSGADLLMIFTIPLKTGIEAALLLKQKHPDVKCVLLTNTSRHPDLFTAMDNGFSGIIHKATSEKELLHALEIIRAGSFYISPEIHTYLSKRRASHSPDDDPVKSKWTEKEISILRYIGTGYHNEEISRLMNLKIRTIEGYKARMIEKAGVPNTLNLILFALKNKLLSIDDL